MRSLRLERFAYTPMGTFGRLSLGNSPFSCYTIEQPWALNKVYVSCIPEGDYLCQRIVSPSKGPTFEVTGVPNRTHILFHAGNTMDDFQGCIGLGLSLGTVNSKWAVLASQVTMKAFFEHLRDELEFQLTITQYRIPTI